jgi:predicted nucleic acid-binding protein
MNDVVVGSIVVAKWVLAEPDSPRALRLTTEIPAASGRLVVLDLVLPEVGNAIWKSHRQKAITLDEAR